MTAPLKKACTCPDSWESRQYHAEACQLYTWCGGWSWDPPCGGCDGCLAMQDAYGALMERERMAKEAGQ